MDRQVAEKRCKQLKKDARKALQTGGVITIAKGRAIARYKQDVEREKAEKKAAREVKQAVNKAKQEEHATGVKARKEERLQKKAEKELEY